jgi:hypothetical protein
MFFLKAISEINKISIDDKIIDIKGLELHNRLLRLFSLRKIITRDRNAESIRICLNSLGNIKNLKDNIPDDVKALEKYILGPKDRF